MTNANVFTDSMSSERRTRLNWRSQLRLNQGGDPLGCLVDLTRPRTDKIYEPPGLTVSSEEPDMLAVDVNDTLTLSQSELLRHRSTSRL